MLALGANFLAWIWLFWQTPRDDQQLFLHYNVLFGVDKVGGYGGVFAITMVGLGILVFNYLAGWLVFGKDKYTAFILNMVGLICQLFVLAGSVLIVFMNV